MNQVRTIDFANYYQYYHVGDCVHVSDGEELFCKDEEQFFATHSDYSYEFSVADKMDTGVSGDWGSDDKELIQYRKIILFKAEKFDNILVEIKSYLQV